MSFTGDYGGKRDSWASRLLKLRKSIISRVEALENDNCATTNNDECVWSRNAIQQFQDDYKFWRKEELEWYDLVDRRQRVLESAMNGKLATLKEFMDIAENVDEEVNACDSKGRTPLHLASAFGHGDIVQFLLQKGALVDSVTDDGVTPLMCGAMSKNVIVVDTLISYGANANFSGNKTPLLWAVAAGNLQCVTKIISAGANPRASSESAMSLLVAAAFSRVDVTNYLIENGADVKLVLNTTLDSALHLASAAGSEECVDILIKARLSPQVRNVYGETPLHVAATDEIIVVLLEHGGNPDDVDVNGLSTVHHAVMKGTPEFPKLRTLVKYGANVNLQDKQGRTPLHLSALQGTSLKTSFLINNGAKASIRDNEGVIADEIMKRTIYTTSRQISDCLDGAVRVISAIGMIPAPASDMRHSGISSSPIQVTSENWLSRDDAPNGKTTLRSTCHNPHFVTFSRKSRPDDESNAIGIDKTEIQHCITKKNRIKLSTRRHRDGTLDIESPTASECSISIEGEGSQGEIDRTNNSVLNIWHDRVRKQSAVSTIHKVWNDENVASCFRDLSPAVGCLLEGAWNGDMKQLEELWTDDHQPNVDSSDIYGRTPLHLAAASGHVEAVEFLLKKGAGVEICDLQQKATPLMCAAGCGSLPVVELLLAHGVNVNAGLESGKTALHWAVQAESSDCARKLLESGALQNPPGAYSETALHVAAASGHLECLQVLIKHGADVSLIKGNDRSTALHLAAWEGSIDCMRYLLTCGASHSAQDARGQTPLHISASSDTDATALLLSVGANPNVRDSNGRTPLHCAIVKGSRATERVRLILVAGAEVNARDCYGYTPLHLAAVNESSSCASILLNNGANAAAKTKAGTSALTLLSRKIPDVVKHLVDRLNSAVTVDHDPADPDCEVRLDFRIPMDNNYPEFCKFRAIVSNNEKRPSGNHRNVPAQMFYHQPAKETEFLTCLIAVGNKEILAHPLSEAFLHLKWRCVRKFFWASLFFLTLLVLLYTIYIMNVYLVQCPYHKELAYHQRIERLELQKWENSMTTENPSGIPVATALPDDPIDPTNKTTRIRRHATFKWMSFSPVKSSNAMNATNVVPEDTSGNETEEVKDDLCQLDRPLTVVWYLLIAFTLILAIKEIFQLAQAPLIYAPWVGIFLAYSLMLLQVGRQPALGLYVQMLGKVAANFGLFILAYVCILIAFALAFCVIYPGNPAFSSPPLAFIKVLTMMVGEVDYEDQFYKDQPLPYPFLAHLLHTAFVVFISIILMNLLVGLAVHDIQGLQEGAKLNRLSRQTALISHLEAFILSRRLQAFLPKSLGQTLQKNAMLVPSSYKWTFAVRPNDPRDQRLPKELKQAVLKLAAANYKAKRASKSYRNSEKLELRPESNDTGLIRLDQRIDKLQQQIDNALKTLNENNEKILSLLVKRQEGQPDVTVAT